MAALATQGSHQDDKNYVVRHVAIKGVQTGSLLAPPITLGYLIYKKRFSLNRWLRASAIGGLGVGSVVGWGLGALRMRNVDEDGSFDRAYRLKMNATQQAVDDSSLIGTFLGSLLTTTVLLRRGPSTIWLLSGGATFGIAGGVIYHLTKTMGFSQKTGKKGLDAVRPTAMIEEVKQMKEEGGLPGSRTAEEIKRGEIDKVVKGK